MKKVKVVYMDGLSKPYVVKSFDTCNGYVELQMTDNRWIFIATHAVSYLEVSNVEEG